MSVRQFGLSNGSTTRQKRFSIDDAFEEETDEAIKVYGATTTCSPVSPGSISNGDSISIRIDPTRWAIDCDSYVTIRFKINYRCVISNVKCAVFGTRRLYYVGSSYETTNNDIFLIRKLFCMWYIVLWGLVACVLLCYSSYRDYHHRFPRLGSPVHVMTPRFELGLGLQTQNRLTTNLPTDWLHGSFCPSSPYSSVFGMGGEGYVVCRWWYRVFQDVSIHLVTFFCSWHVPVFSSLVLSMVRAGFQFDKITGKSLIRLLAPMRFWAAE